MIGADAGAAGADERSALASTLAASPHVLLETCHRVELYGTGDPEDRDGLKLRTGETAVRHLCRVAAGLESATVGEVEILGQVRTALERARARGSLAPELSRLFETAISAGRRARSHDAAPSAGLADSAVEWLGRQTELIGARVLVAGGGGMGKALRIAVSAAGAEAVVATRRPSRDQLDLAEAADQVASMDGIAIALSGPWRELTSPPGVPVVDLSSPSALAPDVRDALGPKLLDIDGLFARRQQAERWSRTAEAAVDAAVAEYRAWDNGRRSTPVVTALLDRLERRRRARLDSMLPRLGELHPRQAELIDQLTRQLVRDVIHEPLAELRRDGSREQREAARRLFGL